VKRKFSLRSLREDEGASAVERLKGGSLNDPESLTRGGGPLAGPLKKKKREKEKKISQQKKKKRGEKGEI